MFACRQTLCFTTAAAVALTAALTSLAYAASPPEKKQEPPPPGAIDFRAALERTAKGSPAVESVEQALRSARLTLRSARAAWLPSLDAQAKHAYNNGGTNLSGQSLPLTPHAPWSNSLGLTLSETLYDNGEALRQAEIALAQAEAAEILARKGLFQALLATAKAYYDFSTAALGVEIQKAQLAILSKQFRTVESRYQQGMSSSRDYLRIKSQAERAEIGVIAAQISLDERKIALRNAIGTREPLEFAPLLPDDQTLTALRFPAPLADDTFDFRITRAQDAASDLKVRSAERANLPRLSLQGSYGYTVPQYVGGRDAVLDTPYWNLQAALVLDWNIWDWGTRGRAVEIADAQRRVDRAGRETQRIQVTQDLARLRGNSERLARTHSASALALRDQQAAYASVEAAFRDGKAQYVDLTQALTELFSARTQHVQIQFDLLRAQADLAYYQGNLDEVLGLR